MKGVEKIEEKSVHGRATQMRAEKGRDTSSPTRALSGTRSMSELSHSFFRGDEVPRGS